MHVGIKASKDCMLIVTKCKCHKLKINTKKGKQEKSDHRGELIKQWPKLS